MLIILWLFSIWSKLERWKSSISGCLMSWPGIKKIIILKCRLHLFYTTTTNHFSIGLWYVIERGFHDDQLSDRTERSSKVLPKAKFVPPKKGHGHCLVVCCWSDPLQLPESWQNHYIWEVCSAEEMHQELQCLQPALVNRKGPVLLCDKARLHFTQSMLQKLNKLGYEMLLYLPFSPDLSTANYSFCKHLNNFL